jgi:hypothetical protein
MASFSVWASTAARAGRWAARHYPSGAEAAPCAAQVVRSPQIGAAPLHRGRVGGGGRIGRSSGQQRTRGTMGRLELRCPAVEAA